ncbi:MAG: hypothetical protein HPY76_03665 [Anaerolineae bacterium]|nr:hypothetical protein [Anaerolineae bacterium]
MKKRLVVPLIATAFVLMSCQLFGGGGEPTAIPPQDTTAPEVPTLPPPTQEIPTQPVPTQETPTEEPVSKYFTEEFDDSLSSDWAYWTAAGDSTKYYFDELSGRLAFELPAPETYHYVEYEGATYDNVYVEAKFETINSGQNGIAIICRSSDDGWYEFRVSTSGVSAGRFNVYRYDTVLKEQNRVPYVNLLTGYESFATLDLVNGRNKSNVIGMLCNGSELAFQINGKQVQGPDKKPLVIEDDTLTDGYFGVGVMSFSQGEVNVEFDYVGVQEP